MARRHARDRVFADHGTDPASDVHADGEDQVVNLSGTPGDPGMSRSEQAVAFDQARAGHRERPGTTPPRPGEHPSPTVGHKTNVQIDAETGERLDSYVAQALAHAAHRADQDHFAAQKDTSPGAYLRHLFGVRDRDDR
jgi:hypothetical protein